MEMIKIVNKEERILLIPDTHFPYEHGNTFDFLRRVKNKYKPTKVIHMGDMIDNYALNYHEKNPDSDSAEDDFRKTQVLVNKLIKLFPRMDILLGNHDKLGVRKAKTIGLPSRYIRSLSEIYNMPITWKWHSELNITMNDGRNLMLKHNLSKNPLSVAKHYNTCYAQGHYHEDMRVDWVMTKWKSVFGITCGSLIDDKSMAMDYNKGNLKRPELGCVLIVNGVPKIIAMKVDSDNEWDGKL